MKCVLLDANLLLLLIVGQTERHHIGQNRLKAYDADAFDLLVDIVESAPQVATTPNVMTEVSNLLGLCLHGETLVAARNVLGNWAGLAFETYIRSRSAVDAVEFGRLGLTDAAVLESMTDEVTLWTDDLGLYLSALRRGLSAQNFTHLRKERGLI